MQNTTILSRALLMALAIPACFGAAITVTNFSFENPAQSPGGFTSGAIPGWSVPAGAGVFRPTASQLAPPTDGVQTGYITAGLGSISQILAATLTANTLYTLRTDFLARIDCCAWGTSELDLIAGSTVLASGLISNLAPGGVQTSTVTFNALPGNPNLGQALQIQISQTANNTLTQINFDNVRLDATPSVSSAPEPGTIGLTSAAILLLALRRRRTR